MSTHVYTSITTNYLPKARVLAQSVKKFHPEFVFHVVLVDAIPPGFDLVQEPFDRLISIQDLGWNNPECWLFQHNRVEASTGVKGVALQKLLSESDCQQAFYFDPDIVVLSRLDGLIAAFDQGSVLLTPHLIEPETVLDSVLDNELCALRHGIYNLGFLGVRNTADGLAFAKWWSQRLQAFCFDDIPRGLFTDQRWIDLAPALFRGVHVLRDEAYNVATWNLTHRHVSGSVPDCLTVNGRPLAFFHFSGLDSGAQQVMRHKYAAAMPSVHRLTEWYEAECARMGQAELGTREWVYSVFDNGVAITPEHRALYRDRIDLQQAFPNPFLTSEINRSYYRWFNAETTPPSRPIQPGSAALDKPLAPASGLDGHHLPPARMRAFVFTPESAHDPLESTLKALKAGAAYELDIQILQCEAEAALAKALALAHGEDFYLVRSGVLVPEYWDARLRWTALREKAVASVSPLSCPYAVPAELTGASVQAIDRHCYHESSFENPSANALSVDLLFVSGAAAREIAENAPLLKGKDFFKAAAQLRWSHVVADHMYVDTRPARASADNDEKSFATYPSVRRAARRRQLHISHSWGGGSGSFCQLYAQADSEHDNLLLQSIGSWGSFGQELWLYRHAGDTSPVRTWRLTPPIKATDIAHPGYAAILGEIVNRYGIDVCLVSSLIGHSLDVLRQPARNVIVLHDYYPFCPALNITFKGQCTQCNGSQLSACTLANPHHRFFRNLPAAAWLELRKEFSRLATDPNTTLVAPSHHVRSNMIGFLPELNGRIAVIPHGTPELASAPLSLIFRNNRLRVVVPGHMNLQKGLELLKAILPKLSDFCDVYLIGCGDEGEPFAAYRGVSVIPRYDRTALPNILANIQPDAGLLLSVVPETFSYTLQELIELGVPPIATNLGSFAERIIDGQTGFLVAPEKGAVLALLRSLADDPSPLATIHRNLKQIKVRRLPEMLRDYETVIARPTASMAAYFCRARESANANTPLRIAQLYWRAEGGSFQETQSAYAHYPAEPEPRILRLIVPPLPFKCAQLRFDPADRSGFVLLYRMQLTDARGRSIWSWDARRTAFEFTGMESVLAVSRGGPAALLYCRGNDPAIYLNIPHADLQLPDGGVFEFQLACPPAERASSILAEQVASGKFDRAYARNGAVLLEQLLNGSLHASTTTPNTAIQQLHAELVAAHSRVRDLERSLSWRMSAPLRALGSLWLRTHDRR